METTVHTLYELNKNIQNSIKLAFANSIWIKAEIAQIKENYSGHCYMELVEKDVKSDKIIAQAKATIWANVFKILKPYFETTTGKKITEGLNILICVKVDFHEVYGISLNVIDIDPAFTVGDLALKKAEIVRKLKEEGIFDMNKELELPLVSTRIAIISSETAAGYTDFVTHLLDNVYNYVFGIKLFPAIMQGDKAESSIIEALDKINAEGNNFDLVAIIRGGGSQLDLSCFDRFELALNVAQFPLPVITGIGHEQDDSIVDMVAHTRLKTPTAVADFIIENVNQFENKLDNSSIYLSELINEILDVNNQRINSLLYKLPVTISNQLASGNSMLDSYIYKVSKLISLNVNKHLYVNDLQTQKIYKAIKYRMLMSKNNIQSFNSLLINMLAHKIESYKSNLKYFENSVKLVDPETILKRGFSITLFNNVPIFDSSHVKSNEIIETKLFKGSIISKVVK